MKKDVLKFLVFIDDDISTHYYNDEIIEESQLVNRTLYFSSTHDALNYFKNLATNGDHQIPDVLFLNFDMPKMSGLDFLEEFKTIKLQERPYIVMSSTSLHPKFKILAEAHELVDDFTNAALSVEYLDALHDKILLATQLQPSL